MHIIIAIALIALFAVVLLMRSRRGSKIPKIDHSPRSRFERVIASHEFEDLVVEQSRLTPVLVDFYANWCAPCHAFSPILSEMAKSCEGSFLLAKIDFDSNKELAASLGVTALPAISLFRDGEKIDGFSGGKLPHSLRFFLAKNGVDVPDDA